MEQLMLLKEIGRDRILKLGERGLRSKALKLCCQKKVILNKPCKLSIET